MIPLLRETASQTAGPYVHIGLAPKAAGFDIFEKNFGHVLTTPQTQGERITIEGRVFDGTDTLVRDVLLEIWQANAQGRYAHPADRQPGKSIDPHFRGWGRSCTTSTVASTASTRSSRVRSKAARAGSWRRTSAPGSLREASTSA